MRKSLLVLGVLVLALTLATGASAGIKNSKHDLTYSGNTYYASAISEGNLELCVFCHTPHGTSVRPLWNRNYTAGTFTMYNKAYSSSMDMTVGSDPGANSLQCLSCHDGTTAFDSLINNAGSGTSGGTYTWNVSQTKLTTGIGYFGTNLTSEHPIAITYDTGDDSAFHTIDDAKTNGAAFYGASANQVECGSCHDPHKTDYNMFLRADNAASALCLACHDL